MKSKTRSIKKTRKIVSRQKKTSVRAKNTKSGSRKPTNTRMPKHVAESKIAAKKSVSDIIKSEKEGRIRRSAPIIAPPEEVKGAVGKLLNNAVAVNFLMKNVSKWAPDVLNMLSTPKTDEYLAEQLDLKINAIRRILNLMQGYGITNYYIAKNTNGWLSFAWYVNTGKVPSFFEYINNVASKKTVINNDCNDYFVCNDCYQKDKLIFTFDAAFEASFRCNGCGKKFTRIEKEAAERLVDDSNQITQDANTSSIENNLDGVRLG
jgi:transcription initiation factor IIE alpha subunit